MTCPSPRFSPILAYLAPRYNRFGSHSIAVLSVLLTITMLMLNGCGGTGYAGDALGNVSSSALTLDAGQQTIVSVGETGKMPVQWTMSGANCPPSGCGSLSAPTNTTTTYTAPSALTATIAVTLRVTIAGTNSFREIKVTVNPAPTITGAPPAGVVGQPYQATFSYSGGTAPLKWSTLTGSLPTGLSFDPSTGIVSGTPTVAGTFHFTLNVVDSATTPVAVSAEENIFITGGGKPQVISIGGFTGTGVVGSPYLATLTETGGTGPFTWAVTNGSLPAGLTLTTQGTITGTPTAPGTSVFVVQVTDSAGDEASATFSINVTQQTTSLTITTGNLPNGHAGSLYFEYILIQGGLGPYRCELVSGALPVGLSLGPDCLVSGTPTAPASVTLVVKVTDSSSPAETITGSVGLVILPPAISSTGGSLPVGVLLVPYSFNLLIEGGTPPYTCSVLSGSLPLGLTLHANCTVEGIPTIPGTFTFAVEVTDSGQPAQAVSISYNITITPSVLNVVTGLLPNGIAMVPYSATLAVTGGTAPYSCSVITGTLPPGLNLGSGCVVSGTPLSTGTFTFTVLVNDTSTPSESATRQIALTVTPGLLSVITGLLPQGTILLPYSAPIDVSGGSGAYTCSLGSGALPTGLAVSSDCLVSGTPTVAGTYTFTVQVTDTSSPAQMVLHQISVEIAPSLLTISSQLLPGGTLLIPYNASISISGGSAPYNCSITGGTLPAGLTLGSNCQITGTPTDPGSFTFTVLVTDSGHPSVSARSTVRIVVSPGLISILTGLLPNGQVQSLYSTSIGVSGGTGPYTCNVAGGTLPPGLNLTSTCAVAGTPTSGGIYTFTVQATDSGSPAEMTTRPISIAIGPNPLTLISQQMPGGTLQIPYSASISVGGGTGPYTCSITGGSLPPGLSYGGSCNIVGTPTNAGTFSFSVLVNDSMGATASGTISITVAPSPLSITSATLPNGTILISYSASIGISGGAGPYQCGVTGGALPTGLTLSSGCQLTGTPTSAGNYSFDVQVTDSGNPVQFATRSITITINPSFLQILTGLLANATVEVPYSTSISLQGGTAPYMCSIATGSLPAGLTLLPNCSISGTPTTPGAANLTIHVTDAENPAVSITGPISITVLPTPITFNNQTLPDGRTGASYSQTLTVSGGTTPYTCTSISGNMPSGLTVLPDCTVSGTPTTSGTANVNVRVTDSSSPSQSATAAVSLTVDPAPSLSVGSPLNGTEGVAYTGSIPVTGGVAPYACALTGGTLPAGLILSGNCSIHGTPTGSGVSNFTVHATDSATPANAATGTVSLTINAPAQLSLSIPLLRAIQNQAFTTQLAAAGGIGPFTYTLASGHLPAGLTLGLNGTLFGTPTNIGATEFSVSVTDGEGTPQTAVAQAVLIVGYPQTPTDQELVGPYAFLLQGYDDVASGVLAYQTASIAGLVADGSGFVTSGQIETNHQGENVAQSTVEIHPLYGAYTIAANNRGTLTTTYFTSSGTPVNTTYSVTLQAPTAPSTVFTLGSLIEADGDHSIASKGSGTIVAQDPTNFANGLSGRYAFGLSGDTPCLPTCTLGINAGPVAAVGRLDVAGGSLQGGIADTNIGASNFPSVSLTGTFASADIFGRSAMQLSFGNVATGVYPANFSIYQLDAGHAFAMSTDRHSDHILLAGTLTQQQGTFSNASLSGSYIGYENTASNPDFLGTTLTNVLDLSTSTIFRFTADGAGNCTTTNVDVGGTGSLVNGLVASGGLPTRLNALLGTYRSLGQSACTVDSNGRLVLNYPSPNSALQQTLTLLGLPAVPSAPRVAYLTGSGDAYFLESGYAGLGKMENQTGSSFTLGTLDGTYTFDQPGAASLASTTSTGVFAANGAGTANELLDENVGVGNLNVLTLGVTGTFPYFLTDAAAGRYLLGTHQVIYAISSGRFVTEDLDPATISPSVSILF